jgi:voltage-gated potassium channel
MSPGPDARTASLRDRFNAFIEAHGLAWELGMGALAIVYVALPFVAEGPMAGQGDLLALLEGGLTVVFLLEFTSRLAASRDRIDYLSRHWIDALALIPVVRGLRLTRLLRLGRLVRTFAGVQRASTTSSRLAPYQTVFNLVLAWAATMLVSALTFYAAENGVNPAVHDGWDALWWSITTITGGSQIQAITEDGRVATAVLLVLGVALFAAITASLIALVAGDRENQHVRSRLSQLLELKDEGHLSDDSFDARLRHLAADRGDRSEELEADP